MIVNKPGVVESVADSKPEQTTLAFDQVGTVAKGTFLSGTYYPKNEHPFAPKAQRSFPTPTTAKINNLVRF